MSAATATWAELNQRHLMAAFERVRALLLLRHADPASAADPADPAPFAASALDALDAGFGLTPFDRDIVVLCAGMELDGGFADVVAAAQRQPRRDYPTFGLALAALPGAHWSALSSASPLRYWRLVSLDAVDSLTAGRLRIDERVLHFLAGVDAPDERLQHLLETEAPCGRLVPSHQALAEQIAARWRRTAAAEWPVLQLCGPADRKSVV